MAPVNYKLADGTAIELRVPTLHPDDKELSKLLNRVGNYDQVLLGKGGVLERARLATDEPTRERAIDAITECQEGQNEAFRKLLFAALKTELGTKDIETKVIAQCTEEDQRNILQILREGPDYLQRLMLLLPLTPEDVRRWLMFTLKTPAELEAFAASLKAPPTSSG